MGAEWVETLPVKRFHGVGPVTAAKMQKLGIETGADLRAKSMDFLQRHFGSSAKWYFRIARGIDERPVNPDRERKSSGSETTFDRDLLLDTEIETGVIRQADDVWAWCERAQAFGRTVTLKVKYSDFQIVTRSRTSTSAISGQEILRRTSLELVRSLLPTEKGIRLVGVTVSNFDRPAQQETLPLFETATAQETA